jgi:Mrp family chromosome partitioning ATPase
VSNAQQGAVFALRGRLWQNGFRPVSVFSPGAVEWTGKPIDNAGKRPNLKNWHESALAGVPDACTAKPSLDALNTGILCDGLIALDLDIDDPALARQAIEAAIHFLGNAPMRVRSDSARVLMLYRASEGEPAKRSIKGTSGKVEALGCGQQFVAFGQHPSGADYRWPQGSPAELGRDALTPVKADALQAFLCAVAPLVGAEQPKPLMDAPAPLSVAPVPAHVTDRDRDYAASALAVECAKLTVMVEGMGRNDALNTAAHSLGTLAGNGSIAADTVALELLDAATVNGHTAKHGISQTKATIESGLNAGAKKPRPLLSEDAHSPALESARQSCRNLLATYKAKQERKHQSAPARGKRSITLVQCSTIQAKPISWIWNGFIPQSKLTLLAGAGGTGKSTLAFNFAATVSNAGMWPDGTRCNVAGNILVWSSEDDAADTITPRLMAVGANLSRCGIISGAIDENGMRCGFDAARDMDYLREAVQQIGGVALLIIDPIVTAVTGDMHKANDVRRSLQAIVDFASEMNCAVIGITHFAKGSAGKDSAERVIGSQAFAALARMVLVAAKEEDSDRRVFTRAKSNNSVDTGGFGYAIEAGTLPGGIEATRVVWGEPLEGSSRSILANVEGDRKEDGEKMRAAKQFLVEMLSNGPAPSKELMKHAREGYGISEDTLRRSYSEIGTKPKRVGFGSNGAWIWALPFANPTL